MRLALILTFGCIFAAHSRPIEVPTYQELSNQADVILILKVQAITARNARAGEKVDTNFYRCYTADCKVQGVLKGEVQQQRLSIPFFQHPQGAPGFNGAVAAPFSLDDGVAFLAFMKRNQKGELSPVTGDYDAGLSIKMMFDRLPDPRHIKLPDPAVKSAEPGAPPKVAPPHR